MDKPSTFMIYTNIRSYESIFKGKYTSKKKKKSWPPSPTTTIVKDFSFFFLSYLFHVYTLFASVQFAQETSAVTKCTCVICIYKKQWSFLTSYFSGPLCPLTNHRWQLYYFWKVVLFFLLILEVECQFCYHLLPLLC